MFFTFTITSVISTRPRERPFRAFLTETGKTGNKPPEKPRKPRWSSVFTACMSMRTAGNKRGISRHSAGMQVLFPARSLNRNGERGRSLWLVAVKALPAQPEARFSARVQKSDSSTAGNRVWRNGRRTTAPTRLNRRFDS